MLRKLQALVNKRAAMIALGLLGSAGAACAQSNESYTPDPTIFAPAATSTGTYLSSLVSTHGVTFLEISMVPIGLFFVWHLMRRAFSA